LAYAGLPLSPSRADNAAGLMAILHKS